MSYQVTRIHQCHVCRSRIAILFASAVLLLAVCVHAAERKPNFLFVYTDDQRWDAMGVVQREQGTKSRFPWLQTPNMDRIAAEGVRFRNAFVTMPLCAPSRAAFLTGRYNHANGVANNHTPFPETNVTHASLLSSAGYATAYIGKWHMGGQRGQRPGFTYSASFIGQGKYWDCPFEINGQQTPTKGWVDDVSTSFAVQFMREHRDKPFAVIVGYKTCHGPNEVPDRAKERFAGVTVRPVPSLHSRAIYRTSGDEETTRVKRDNPTPNANYFRNISAADDNLGILLKTIDELGLRNDTVVVFASDNGYYFGEHGLGDKRSLYDESIRIPLIAQYPKHWAKGKTIDEMVLNIDLAPTLLELAGVKVPAEMQGRSWAGLIDGTAKDWRKSFLAEYFFERAFPTTPNTVAVRTADAKLIKYPGHEEWTELFDLKNDPYEMKNLIADPAAQNLRTRMQGEFDAQVTATHYLVPEYADAMTSAPTEPAKPGKADRPAKRAKRLKP